jgi:threonylcarbamoyladenosine tRNA methylthiotransferase MtaB
MQEKNIKILTFGCRLNSLESEKIRNMLSTDFKNIIIVNTCAVTAEAERGSAQAVRKLSRENPYTVIFVTGCGATRNKNLFAEIPNCIVIDNKDKMDKSIYAAHILTQTHIDAFNFRDTYLSKQFIQIQNGCNHQCTYCVTRLLRGKNVSFNYSDILSDIKQAIKDGFYEIVLTGVDIASFAKDGILITDLCKQLLNDAPEIRRLRLSSMDPASPEIPKLIALMQTDSRMMPHLHLSMQSGSDTILKSMLRRHDSNMVRKFMLSNNNISFSWDLICGFPGETDELFNETLNLIRELKPIKIHAFPYSPRPETVAATMPNQINRNISKERVKIVSNLANQNKLAFMQIQIGTITQVLIEKNNIARTPDDIEIKIIGTQIIPKTICNLKINSISDLHFVGKIC